MPIARPRSPTTRAHPNVDAASTETRARTAAGQHAFAVRVVLLLEQLHRRHRNDARRRSARIEQLLGVERERDFGAGRDQDRDRLGRRSRRARRRHARPAASRTPRNGSFWRESTRAVGPSCAIANFQASSVSSASAGRMTVMFGIARRRGQLLDRLMRRAVFAQEHRIVRIDEDRLRLIDRRQPHRRLHVIDEVEERRRERHECRCGRRGHSRSRPSRVRARRSGCCGPA